MELGPICCLGFLVVGALIFLGVIVALIPLVMSKKPKEMLCVKCGKRTMHDIEGSVMKRKCSECSNIKPLI